MKRLFIKHIPITVLKSLLLIPIAVVSIPLMLVDTANNTNYFCSVWQWLADLATEKED